LMRSKVMAKDPKQECSALPKLSRRQPREEFIKLLYYEKVVDMIVVEEFEELRGELSRRFEAR